MADNTHIEWTDATWNPITGCSIVSPGCTHCYAMKLAGSRLKHTPSRKGLTTDTKAGPVWNGEVRFNEQWLDQPLRWKRPRRIFVCAHGDLFHEDVPDEWIDRVFAIMALAPQHTFQVLTKRAKRMREYMLERWQPAPSRTLPDGFHIPAEQRGETRRTQVERACEPFLEQFGLVDTENDDLWTEDGLCKAMQWQWPLPNVWLGVSAERQQEADERIPELLATPAAIRFVSAEPLLGPIDFGLERGWCRHCGKITPGTIDGHEMDPSSPCFEAETTIDAMLHWIIVGGESGQGARPMHPDWARSIRDQCARAGTAFFFKQWGAWVPFLPMAGGDLGGDIRADRVRIVHPSGRTDVEVSEATGGRSTEGGSRYMASVGKKAAGRLLDGVEHSAFPVTGRTIIRKENQHD